MLHSVGRAPPCPLHDLLQPNPAEKAGIRQPLLPRSRSSRLKVPAAPCLKTSHKRKTPFRRQSSSGAPRPPASQQSDPHNRPSSRSSPTVLPPLIPAMPPQSPSSPPPIADPHRPRITVYSNPSFPSSKMCSTRWIFARIPSSAHRFSPLTHILSVKPSSSTAHRPLVAS